MTALLPPHAMPQQATARVIPLRRPDPAPVLPADDGAGARLRAHGQRRLLVGLIVASAVLHHFAVSLHLLPARPLVAPPPETLTVRVLTTPPVIVTPPAPAPLTDQIRERIRERLRPAAPAPVPAPPTPVIAVPRGETPPAFTVPQAERVPETPPSTAPQTATAAPARSGPARAAASYLHNPLPEYPSVARRYGQEGLVTLEVLVSERGQPLEVKLAKSSGFSTLDQAAVDGVKRWTFTPAKEGDTPVVSRVEVPVRFRLDGR